MADNKQNDDEMDVVESFGRVAEALGLIPKRDKKRVLVPSDRKPPQNPKNR